MASPDIRQYNQSTTFEAPRREPPPGMSQFPSETRPVAAPDLNIVPETHPQTPNRQFKRMNPGGKVVRMEEKINTGMQVGGIAGSEILIMSWNERQDCNTQPEKLPECPFLKPAADVYVCTAAKKVDEPYGPVLCPLVPNR